MPEELKINDTFYEDKNNFLEAASKLTCEPENIKRMKDYLSQRLDDASMAIKLNDAKALENALDAFRKSYKPMYNALERYLEIDKRRAEAFEIIEDLRPTKSDTDGSINIINFIELREKDDEKMVFLDSDDQSFIRNNYGTIFVSLKNDIEKYITYNSSDEQVNAFINDLNKIKSTFKEIVSEDFNIKTLATAENVLPEDHCKNKLSEYANKRVSDIIHVHNIYCINKTKKDFDNRIENLEKIDDVNKEKLEKIKHENDFFNRPVNLANAEMTDGFVKIFKDIKFKFAEIDNELQAKREQENQHENHIQ